VFSIVPSKTSGVGNFKVGLLAEGGETRIVVCKTSRVLEREETCCCRCWIYCQGSIGITSEDAAASAGVEAEGLEGSEVIEDMIEGKRWKEGGGKSVK